MNKLIAFLFIAVLSFGISAQDKKASQSSSKDKNSVAKTENSSLELAKMSLAAHGGDKFKNMKTLIIRGTADVSGSPTATFPAAFTTVYAGDKYRLEITNPFQPFKQIYDGRQTFSSVDNFYLPPINRLGLPLLPKIEAEGFKVSALEKSKKKGFRITSPEGYFTDFFVDEKTNQIKSYEASYEYNGRKITTSVEIDKMRDVGGIIIPERYAQRFDLGQLTIYANFKAKEILVDSEVTDDVFTMK